MSAEREAVYVCPECGRDFTEPGKCPDHPAEVLMDGTDREVLFYLMRCDDQARNKVYAFWALVCFVAGLALGAAVGYGLYAWSGGRLPGRIYTWLFVGGGILGGFAGTVVARKLFRPRFRKHTRRLEQI
ncbi:MAG: hypothetical protein JXR96_19715 [Deltaproteobacteria bacterium]|nr:hypothetical protein [Deltaproteobacteria bacterium]